MIWSGRGTRALIAALFDAILHAFKYDLVGSASGVLAEEC